MDRWTVKADSAGLVEELSPVVGAAAASVAWSAACEPDDSTTPPSVLPTAESVAAACAPADPTTGIASAVGAGKASEAADSGCGSLLGARAVSPSSPDVGSATDPDADRWTVVSVTGTGAESAVDRWNTSPAPAGVAPGTCSGAPAEPRDTSAVC